MSWFQVAMGAAQLWSGQSAKSKARSVASETARLTRFETREQLRRMDREQRYRLGAAELSLASSGVLNQGSAAQVMSAIEQEYAMQRRWTKMTGDQRAALAAKGAGRIGMDKMIEGIGNLGAGVSGFGSNTSSTTNQNTSTAQPTLNYNQRMA